MTRSPEDAPVVATVGDKIAFTGTVAREHDIWECDHCPDPGGAPHGHRLIIDAREVWCQICERPMRLHPAGVEVEIEIEAELGEDGVWTEVRRPGGRNWSVKALREEPG